MYTTLEQVKQFLRITDSTDDILLDTFILQTKSTLDGLIGDLMEGNRVFLVTRCEMRCNHIRLLTRNITALVSIDSTAYTGVLHTDYEILPPYSSLLYIKDLSDYLDSDTIYHRIEVTSGFDPIPENLILLQNLMIGQLYSLDKGREIESYKLGDRNFKFGSSDNDTTQKTIDTILNLYKLLDYT